ncbi:chondroitin sulfate proteoglycan 5 [Paroedura picta]|uniref:chondroitin sulfate proteoglycan 5 n=1 Tax=Paroedura picta TaxID=143630 RepID=UPI004055E85D
MRVHTTTCCLKVVAAGTSVQILEESLLPPAVSWLNILSPSACICLLCRRLTQPAQMELPVPTYPKITFAHTGTQRPPSHPDTGPQSSECPGGRALPTQQRLPPASGPTPGRCGQAPGAPKPPGQGGGETPLLGPPAAGRRSRRGNDLPGRARAAQPAPEAHEPNSAGAPLGTPKGSRGDLGPTEGLPGGGAGPAPFGAPARSGPASAFKAAPGWAERRPRWGLALPPPPTPNSGGQEPPAPRSSAQGGLAPGARGLQAPRVGGGGRGRGGGGLEPSRLPGLSPTQRPLLPHLVTGGRVGWAEVPGSARFEPTTLPPGFPGLLPPPAAQGPGGGAGRRVACTAAAAASRGWGWERPFPPSLPPPPPPPRCLQLDSLARAACAGCGCGGGGSGVHVQSALPSLPPSSLAGLGWAGLGRAGGVFAARLACGAGGAEPGCGGRDSAAALGASVARMGRPAAPAPAAPAARLAALLALLAALDAASEPPPRPPNATDFQAAPWQGGRRPPVTVSGEASGPDPRAPWRNNASAAPASSQAAGPKESHPRPPTALPEGPGPAAASDDPMARGPPEAGLPVRLLPGERDQMGTTLCLGCLGGGSQAQKPLGSHPGPMEALSSGITGFALPAQEQGGPRKRPEKRDLPGSASPLPESQEEAGSGDQHAKASPGEGDRAEWTALPTVLEFALETSSLAGRDLSYGTDERDLLLGTTGEAVLPPPTLSGPIQTPEETRRAVEPDSAQKEEPLELWIDSWSSSPSQGGQGRSDLSGLNTEAPRLAATPSVLDLRTSKPSSDPSASEIIDIDYYDLFEGDGLGGPGPDSTKRKPAEDKGMSWSLHDLYDDFTPFDESDFYPTTSFYIDGDEEELEEPEDDEEEEDGGGGLARDLEDENEYRIPTPGGAKIQTVAQEAEATSRRYVIPPLQTFVVSGGNGGATSRPRPAESGRDQSLSGGTENSTDCRIGYVRHNNSCKSVCDIFPSYCHNGGQCYLVENLGAFCRCNTQDYIWHKGTRCESIITDFQVMCVAVGSAALVVLLLFMMTVFFAKKLYLLKTENNKLRKTNRYRTPSELHNDNFSLSTIAEGSHPNVRKFCDTPRNLSPHARALAYYDNIICQDDPSAPHKLQDPLKSCLKEEESFNIQNSESPKLDHGKGEAGDSEGNCLQNNLT